MHKKFFVYSNLALIMVALVFGFISYNVDPLQQFRINNYGMGSQREMNIGISRNTDSKMIILGTSTSENFLRKDAEKIFSKKTFNLSISGSTNYEQRRLLKEIIKNKNIEQIIYGLDLFTYNYEIKETKVNIHSYILGDSIIEKIKYIYSMDSLKAVIKVLLKRYNKGWDEKYGYWGDSHTYNIENLMGLNSEIQTGAQNLGIIKKFKEGYFLDRMCKNFDEFLKIVKSNENIEYKIFFTPYHMLYWRFSEKYLAKEILLKFKKYVILSTENLKNIEIYDFQTVDEIVLNGDNYKDIVHYGPFINKKILEYIKEKKYLVKDYNYKEELEKINRKIKLVEEEYKRMEKNI